MPAFKTVFFDLDGTILTSDFSIPKHTVSCLNIIKNKGLRVSIATGRSEISSRPFLFKLGITEPAVYSNGAVYQCPITNKLKYLDAISANLTKKICKILIDSKIAFKIHDVNGTVYSYLKKEWNNDPSFDDSIEIKNNIVNQEYLKIVILWPKSNGNLFDSISIENKIISQINIFRSGNYLLEISNKNINKFIAIKKIISVWKITTSQLITVGDQENDFEMIRKAGFGVSIANGFDGLDNISKLQIPSPENQGIMKLTQYIIDNF